MADEILNSFDDISGEEEEGEEVEEVVEEKADKSNENSRKITAKNNEIENDLAVAELNDSGNNEDVGEEEECDDDDGDDEYNEDIADKTDENDSDDGMSDKLFNQVLSELITLKSHAEFKKKKQSKVIPCAKKFLSLNMSQRSKCLTTTVRKNLLHICEFVYKGKFPIDISIDNKRFLKHLLDKRTPKEDVQVGLTEDLRTHAIIREVIDQIESSDGYGTC
jgi:hypothetical protein